jgi:hypothetical protein
VKTAVGRRIFWRRLAGVVVLLGAAALLGSCGVVSAMLDTQQGLKDAGYQSVHVGFHDNGGADDVDVTVTVAAEPTQTDTVNVASVVWAKLHERFDNLDVTVHGGGTSVSRRFTFDEIQQTFGARNPSYNSTTVSDSVKQLGFGVLAGLAFAGVVITVVIVLTRKRRRKRQAVWAGGSPGPGGYWTPGPPSQGAPWPGGHPPGATGPAQFGSPGLPPTASPGPPIPGPPPTAAPGLPPPGRPLWPPPPYPPRPVEPGFPPSAPPLAGPAPTPPPGGPHAPENGSGSPPPE